MRIKKWLVILSSVLLVFVSFAIPVSSNENIDQVSSQKNMTPGKFISKDEVVYGNLHANGQINNLYVVNSFNISEPGEIVDYGEYTNIRNLTNLSDIEQNEKSQVLFQTEEEEFYYQGELENQPLPWNISIKYLIDGKEMDPEEIAGESGNFEIQITTSANKDVNPVFFENYLLQISITLDPLVFNDIQAPKGTEANAGKNKQIAFNVMPDQDEELILTASVTNFEMEPIDITAVPANIGIDTPDLGDMTDDMQTLSDAIRDINDGVSELTEGISELNTGTSELSSGSNEYRDGMNSLNQSSGDLINGSKEIRDALKLISEGLQASPEMPDMSEIQELPEGLRGIAKGLEKFIEGLNDLKEGFSLAYKQFDESIDKIPHHEIDEEQFNELYASNADPIVISQLVETYIGAQTVKQTYAAVEKGFAIVPIGIEEVTSGIEKVVGHLITISTEIENEMKSLGELEALEELQKGLSTLSSEYQLFHNGVVQYTEGVNTLASSYQQINTGIQELSNGVSSLDSGVGELHEGTKELHEETSDIPDEIQSEIDELMAEYDFSDFTPVSFVSERNEKIEVVQFVLQTEKIEVKEPEVTEEQPKKEKSIWGRFLDLFR